MHKLKYMKENKILYGILISLTMIFISIFAANIINLITDEVFINVGSAISYRGLLQIILLLLSIITLIILYFKKSYFKIVDNVSTKSQKFNDVKEPTKKEINEVYKYLLSNLSKDEKSILKEYIDKDTKTNYYSKFSGVVGGLEKSKILYISSNIGQGPGAMFPFNIQLWAWEMLKKNPKYLE